jgi:hypothetical protein
MAATLTRRALRRARLGGRHTYRAAARHRVAVAITAAVAALALGTAVAAEDLTPPALTGPWAHEQMHGPIPGPMPGPMHGPMHGPMPDHHGSPGRN